MMKGMEKEDEDAELQKAFEGKSIKKYKIELLQFKKLSCPCAMQILFSSETKILFRRPVSIKNIIINFLIKIFNLILFLD